MLRLKSQGEQKATLEMENHEGLLEVSLVSKAKHRNQETFFAVLFKIDFCLQVPCDATLF